MKRSENPGLSILAELPGTELVSILMDAYGKRAAAVSPADVLAAWENDRFVQPSKVSPLDILRLEKVAYSAAGAFEPIELSPLCPLGTNTALAPLSQNKILGTIRGNEVVADSTTVMALECALRRRKFAKAQPKDQALVKLCASHRLLRVQKFDFPGAMAHFRVFSLCTAGRDTGNYSFEATSMAEHIGVLCKLLRQLCDNGFFVGDLKICLYGNEEAAVGTVREGLAAAALGAEIELNGKREGAYYPSVSFKLWAKNKAGSWIEIADGGIVIWTQKLLGNSKERLMTSGMGTDRAISSFKIN